MMAFTSTLSCENSKNIIPACEQISRKLDRLLCTQSAVQCLPGEQISHVKQSLLSEINDLKQFIKLDQDYLQSVKDDLTVCKDKIAMIEVWENSFNRLDPLLPAIRNPTPAATLNTVAAAPKKGDIPTFRVIEEQEWNNIPSYLKLRMKLNQVNDFVQALNRELVEKYTLLKKKKSTLKTTELTLRISYIALETDETKGSYFVVASDLKRQGFSEKTVSNMSTILRHCRRMREVRTGKITRLIVTN